MTGGVDRIYVIDSHTAGEPTRIVISGGPELGEGSVPARLALFREKFDHFRSAVVNEPRGSDVMVGGLLVAPQDTGCAAGVIFFNNVGYLGMCGHGTIGLVVTLAHLGRIGPGLHRLETPVGIVTAELHENGEVSVQNVASYRLAKDVRVNVEGHGEVMGDIAWGGNWFFLVNGHGQSLELQNVERLTEFTWRVRQALEKGKITGAGGAEINHIELFGASTKADVQSKNFVLCPGKAYDRSPCGTGTSAKLACLFADGKLEEGEIWRQESIVGTVFEGSIRQQGDDLIPTIKGSAYITAEATLVLDQRDPFRWGHSVMMHADVLIVGAGIVGAACADALSAEGFSVVIIESRSVSAGATAAGMGHLVVMDDSEAQFALTRYSVSLWNALAAEMPESVELDSCGTLWVAADEEEMAEVRRKHRFYAARGVATEILDSKQVAEAEPNLRRGLAGGLRVPGDKVLYPPTAAHWLLDCAIARGAKLVQGDVVELSGRHARLRDGCRFSGEYAINAAGILSPRLTTGLDVRPRKGHLIITDRYPNFIHHQLIELGYLKSAHGLSTDSVAFNVQPRKTGQILIGSSRQYGSEDSAIEHSILRRMIQRASEYMPAIGRLSAIRAWAGFRPSTSDKLPLIGPTLGDPQLFLATGHEGLGITTSLATARLIADRLRYRTSAIDPAPYLPARFAKEAVHG